MSKALEYLKGLPLSDLRKLVAFKENEEEIVSLQADRDHHLAEADRIQKQIDSLITEGTGIIQKKRHGPTVRAMCAEALRGKRSGLTAAQIKDAILERHPHRQSKTLYNQVFIALTRNAEFKRGKDGTFTLKK